VIWPSSMTWEYVDWFGVPKASYYDQKQAYEPLHVGAVFDELFTAPGEVFRAELFVANDTWAQSADAEVLVRVYDISLSQLADHRVSLGVRARETVNAGFFTWTVPEGAPDQVLFLVVDLCEKRDGNVLSRSVYTPRVGAPAMRMPYLKAGPWIRDVRNATTSLTAEWSREWHMTEEGLTARLNVTNEGGRPAYRVRLACPEKDHELRYSDNHFWLESGETRVVQMRTRGNPPDALQLAAWNVRSQTLPMP
jgi:beta-mannosidase